MRSAKWLSLVGPPVCVVGLIAAAYATRARWLPYVTPAAKSTQGAEPSDGHAHGPVDRVKLSPTARANLNLVVRPVQPQTWFRTLAIPGRVIDRPGLSDRGVTAPITGVVTQIHARPGETVRPGDRLFGLRLISESLQNVQTELFKTTRDVQLVQEQKARLEASRGSVSDARLVELDQQLRRLAAAAQAYRQDLLARGLTPEQIAAAAEGRFVAEMTVLAPPSATSEPVVPVSTASLSPFAYEVQELKVNLGEQVQAGQTLGVLADHRDLLVEGRAFKQEAHLLARAAEGGWPIRAEFTDDDPGGWPPFDGVLRIDHLANTVDPVSRTFAVYLPLGNAARSYDRGGRTFLLWRFRPGQRVRLHVPVEKVEDVFVLPADAVVREGAEAYVFRQNGDAFERVAVHVRSEDAREAVIANDGSLGPGMHVAHTGAAALNRARKALTAGGGHEHHHDH